MFNTSWLFDSLLQKRKRYLSSTLLVNLCPKLCFLNDLALRLKLVLAIVSDPGVISSRLAIAHLTQLSTLSTPLSSSWVCCLLPATTSCVSIEVSRPICSGAQVSAPLPLFLPHSLTTPTLTPTSSIAPGSALSTPSVQKFRASNHATSNHSISENNQRKRRIRRLQMYTCFAFPPFLRLLCLHLPRV